MNLETGEKVELESPEQLKPVSYCIELDSINKL